MCLVIDTCCLSPVFDSNNRKHSHFIPVLDWITNGKGRLLYGGTKYNQELRAAARYLRLVVELNRKGRAIQVPTEKVDEVAKRLKVKCPDLRFNDEHIAAIVIVSRCCVVCTNDVAALPFLKRRDLYAEYGMKKPKIYSSRRNQSLCCDNYLVPICRK